MSLSYKNFANIVVDSVDPAALRGKAYIFLKVLEGFAVSSLEVVHFPQNFHKTGIITADISAREGVIPAFLITAKVNKTPAQYNMGFQAIGVRGNIGFAYPYRFLITSIPVFLQSIPFLLPPKPL
jgi:hypothetical protein